MAPRVRFAVRHRLLCCGNPRTTNVQQMETLLTRLLAFYDFINCGKRCSVTRSSDGLQCHTGRAAGYDFRFRSQQVDSMHLQLTRPDVADMVLRTFERSIHPELFESVCQSSISFGGRRVRLRLGRTGHLMEFQDGDSIITEVAATKHEDMPLNHRVVCRRLIGYRTHMIDLPTVRYHCSYQLEHVPLDVYLQLHREFEVDATKATLALSMPGATPQSPNCISMLKCDVLPEGVVVHAFHTYPDNAAVLRTQTLFETLQD